MVYYVGLRWLSVVCASMSCRNVIFSLAWFSGTCAAGVTCKMFASIILVQADCVGSADA